MTSARTDWLTAPLEGGPGAIDVVPATPASLDAATRGALPAVGAAEAADGYEVFPGAAAAGAERLRHGGDEADGWWTWFFVTRAPPRRLVGLGGFKGPPAGGLVELGYGIAPGERGRGYATAATHALVARALADPRVEAVFADTPPVAGASDRVLRKAGFARVAAPTVPLAGEVWRHRLRRVAPEDRLVHLVPEAEWDAHERRGIVAPPSLAAEGFVHLSTPSQVEGTLARFFRDRAGLLALVVDGRRLDPGALRFEAPAEGGDARFPHLYGPLPLDAVGWVARVPA